MSGRVEKMAGYAFSSRTDVTGIVECSGTEYQYRYDRFSHYFNNGDDQLYRGGSFVNGLKALECDSQDYTFRDFEATIIKPHKGFCSFVPTVTTKPVNKPVPDPDPEPAPDDIIININPDDAW